MPPRRPDTRQTMIKGGDKARLLSLAWLAVCCLPSAALAQNGPMSLIGEVVTGVASSKVNDGRRASESVTPFTANFDFRSYLGHPDFLSFRVQPRLNFGGQASQAGFDGRNGIAVSGTFLRRRWFPLTVNYSNFRVESVSFDVLQGLNAVRQSTRYSEFGANWRILLPKVPQFSLYYNQSDGRVNPEIDLLQARTSENSRYGIRGSDQRWGWDLEGEFGRTLRAMMFKGTVLPGLGSLDFEQSLTIAEGRARRSWGTFANVGIQFGRHLNRNVVNRSPLDQDRTFARGSAQFQWANRWMAQGYASYDSNRNDLFPRPLAGAPSQTLPFETGISTLAASGQIRYKLHRHWQIFGGLEHTHSRSRFQNAPRFDGTSRGINSGVSFNRGFSWGQLDSSYAFGRTASSARLGTMTNDTLSHSFTSHYRGGRLNKVEVSGLVNFFLNRVESGIFLTNRDLLGELTLGKGFGHYVVRGGINFNRLTSQEYLEFSSNQWGITTSVENRLFNVRYMRNLVHGESLIATPVNGGQFVRPVPKLPLASVLSSSARQMVTVTLVPRRRLQLRAHWFQLDQTLGRGVRNDSNFLNLEVQYRFRRLEMEFGYSTYTQSVLGFSGIGRRSLFFRVRRVFLVF